MAWLNRIGLFLTFISFWLAAPEILGEQKLRRLYELGISGFLFVFYNLFLNAIYVVAIIIILFVWSSAIGKEVADSGSRMAIALVIAIGISYLATFALNRIIERVIVKPLLLKLADSGKLRRHLLLTGATVFTFGFILQFIGTFLKQS